MAKTNNIIEINGQRYDAATGVPILAGGLRPPARPQPKHKIADIAPQPVATAAVSHKTAKKTVRRAAKSLKAHAPSSAHTLMRHAVKKPAAKHHIKAQGFINDLTTQPLGDIVVSQSAASINDRRLHHAKHINQSHLIKHFSAIKADFQPPAVNPQPDVKPVTAALKTPTAVRAAANRRPQTTADLLEKALQNASPHPQAAVKSRKHHSGRRAGLVTASAIILLAVTLGGRGLTDLRLHMASAQAGFSASLPGYHPAGYSLGQLQSSSGEVAAQFHSNSSISSYSVTQKASDWDSPTLADSFVAPLDPHYQTVNSDGLIIYIYNQHNATWVNGGLWYIIQGNDTLTGQQLIQLATSL